MSPGHRGECSTTTEFGKKNSRKNTVVSAQQLGFNKLNRVWFYMEHLTLTSNLYGATRWIDGTNRVCLLNKSLYSLRQATNDTQCSTVL